MHDIRLIRDPEYKFDDAMARRGISPQADAILALDTARRAALTVAQEGQARRNALSKEFGEYKRRGETPPASLTSELHQLRDRVPAGEKEATKLEAEIQTLLSSLPNAPAAEVPDGADETGNKELTRWGKPRVFDFTPKEHADLGPPLGLDFETGASISGARFTFLRGQMARLQRGLGQFMLDTQTAAGFTECAPPLLVRDEAVFGTGQLPKFGPDLFSTFVKYTDQEGKDLIDRILQITEDVSLSKADKMAGSEILVRELIENPAQRRWLIPTAEVSLTNSVREQILADAALPIRMTALTPCFRSEAGAAGKDTRGYIRQHQFEKVELVSICRPDESEAEHERMVEAAEAILRALDLPYRKMLLCAGDMGFTARKTYDLEVWLPGQDAYREISSVSNCGDFQARRMNTRYRPAGEKGTQFVHTLNGSGLAVGRTLVAVLENCQEADGSVSLPQVLHPYMGGVTRLTPD